jgi:High potential iron-sulfur protein
MRISRRSFVTSSALTAATVITASPGRTQNAQFVSESDPPAAELGFRSDASTVDKQKFPQYAAGQSCSACAFYGGEPGAADGTCQIYGTKRVQSKAWCAAFFKRP